MTTVIKTGKFNNAYSETISKDKSISDWPVVYILSNNKEAYVGETVNMPNRAAQHYANEERRRLSTVNVIKDDTFNKSVILDLESYLIKYMSADGKFSLQNGNGGISDHDYYNRRKYEDQFESIWDMLKKKGLASHTIEQIENSDLFKYSPYKSLSSDQYRAMFSILENISDGIKDGIGTTSVVSGGPGTGKTVLAVYLLKLLADNNANGALLPDSEDIPEEVVQRLEEIGKTLGGLKIGLVVPMQALRKTITGVSSQIRNLNKGMILKPTDVPKDYYDILIVDEAHRLRRRKALSQYPAYDDINKMLGLDKEGTELDWIKKCSTHQVLFYDSHQSVRPCDVDKEDFEKLLKEDNIRRFVLDTQFRCQAGDEYINYIADILSDEPPADKKTFGEYDLRLFDDPNEMIDCIKLKDNEYGLCRNVAGYAWKWLSKKDKKKHDFNFNQRMYYWNSKIVDWVNSKNAVNEIGCIHTIQGYDLNYVGVIIGNDVHYNPMTKKIEVDKANYHDQIGKTVDGDMNLLRRQILNVYYTLLTRGIRGTYVYVCDDELREYFRKYIK